MGFEENALNFSHKMKGWLSYRAVTRENAVNVYSFHFAVVPRVSEITSKYGKAVIQNRLRFSEKRCSLSTYSSRVAKY